MIQTSHSHIPMGTREHLTHLLLQSLSHGPCCFPLPPSKPFVVGKACSILPRLWVNVTRELLPGSSIQCLVSWVRPSPAIYYGGVSPSPRGWIEGDQNNQVLEINRKIFFFYWRERGFLEKIYFIKAGWSVMTNKIQVSRECWPYNQHRSSQSWVLHTSPKRSSRAHMNLWESALQEQDGQCWYVHPGWQWLPLLNCTVKSRRKVGLFPSFRDSCLSATHPPQFEIPDFSENGRWGQFAFTPARLLPALVVKDSQEDNQAVAGFPQSCSVSEVIHAGTWWLPFKAAQLAH